MKAKLNTLVNRVKPQFIASNVRTHAEATRRYAPVLYFLLLALIVMAPLFLRGYIIRYDMVFAPYVYLNLDAINSGNSLYSALPVRLLLKIISLILPMDIAQKLILTGIFFLSGYSMYRSVPVRSYVARLVAGTIYTINPFTYDRFMAGHWLFLLAYALTPFVLRAFYNLFTRPRRKSVAVAALLWTLLVLINSHHLLIIGVLFACMCLFFVRSKQTLLAAAMVVVAVLILNIWWLVPAVVTPNFTQAFNLDQYYAFRTKTDLTHGLWFNMLALHGFWFTDWRSVKDFISVWPLVTMVWLLPVFVGLGSFKVQKRSHQKMLFGLLLASVVALLLAAGPSPSTWRINTWLFEHIPGLSGMREPQKFLALLALAYSVLAAFGVELLIKRRHLRTAAVVVIATVAATFALAWPMLWGGNGQVDRTHYPAAWHEFKTVLDDNPNAKAIVLPWELYTSDTFVDTLVANPAKSFYGGQVVQSQRMNIQGVTDSEPPEHTAIATALEDQDVRQLISVMDQLSAEYILITDVHERSRYNWLIDGNTLTIVVDNANLLVLKR